MTVYLHGNLGAGKTTLVRGLLRALGYREKVKSPSYNLLELYPLSKLDLYHFDFYRLKEPQEWQDAGFREYLSEHATWVVEWPEKAEGTLPPPDISVALQWAEPGRIATVTAHTPAGRRVLAALRNCPDEPQPPR